MGKNTKDLFNEIIKGNEIRQNLSLLRQEIKVTACKAEFVEAMKNEFQWLLDLLGNEDAKTRKNAVLLLGDLKVQESLDLLFSGYLKEEQLFVKSAYLTAIGNLDYDRYLPEMREQLDLLSKVQLTEENRKHISEEIRELSQLIVSEDGIVNHEFVDGKTLFDVVLLCNRNHRELIYHQLKETEMVDSSDMKLLTVGVRLQTNRVKPVAELRTYQELLFLVQGMKTCSKDPKTAAETIVNSHLLEFLGKCHKSPAPFYFRIEVKSKMEMDKKSAFSKKTAGYIEELSGRKLINSTSNYEVELRFIEDKDENLNIMIKLYTLEDHRFDYRKEVTPTSIKPVNAALLVSLASEFMVEDARVLDPFCGVGTMLIERQMQVKANTSYGIDIMEDAIEGAKINTEAAGQIIHYINKNFFDFTHEYLFDEIFTNMPFAIGRKTQEEINLLYQEFFEKAKTHLVSDGRIIMYTHDQDLVETLVPEYGYNFLANYEINKKEGTHLYILEK